MGLVGGTTTSFNNFKMADGGHIEFCKMLIPPYCMKIFAQNLLQRCNTTMRIVPTWSKTEPKVNKFGTQIKKQTTTMSVLPNSLIIKIQNGCSRHIEFRKTSISPDWMKIFPPKLVDRCIMDISRWSHEQKINRNWKLICAMSSCFQPTCIRSPYQRIHIQLTFICTMINSSAQ